MNVTIPLDADLTAFVESQLDSGRFNSASEVVREALHLLRSVDVAGAYTIEELRAAWQEGLASGDAGEIDFEDLKREARAGLAK